MKFILYLACFIAGFIVCLRIQYIFSRQRGILYRIAKLFHLIPRHRQCSNDDLFSPSQRDAEAQYRKGRACQSGRGGKKNLAEAKVWYRKAAKQGHLRAQLELATISAYGPLELRDQTDAVDWWTEAARQGDEMAQYELGLCYALGKGVKKSHAEALRWWQQAAQQNEMYSLCAIGNCYANGVGVKQDYTEAVRWWKKAADVGSIEAREKLQALAR